MADIPVVFTVDPLTKAEHVAIKAMSMGEADAGQQVLVLATIVKNFSRPTELAYIPGSQDQSAFLAGRAFVGQQLLKYINLPVEADT